MRLVVFSDSRVNHRKTNSDQEERANCEQGGGDRAENHYCERFFHFSATPGSALREREYQKDENCQRKSPHTGVCGLKG